MGRFFEKSTFQALKLYIFPKSRKSVSLNFFFINFLCKKFFIFFYVNFSTINFRHSKFSKGGRFFTHQKKTPTTNR